MADSTPTPWNDQQRLRLLLSWLTQQLADKASRYVATSPAGDNKDSYALLSASYELYEQAQQLLHTAVTLNRASGVSWQAIADVTGGSTPSAAHQRYNKHTQGIRDRANLVDDIDRHAMLNTLDDWLQQHGPDGSTVSAGLPAITRPDLLRKVTATGKLTTQQEPAEKGAGGEQVDDVEDERTATTTPDTPTTRTIQPNQLLKVVS